MENNLSSKITSSLAWKILELIGTQGIQFVVSIILARILSPSEFGTISLITIFLTVANTFVQSGFATALVQKKDIDSSDYSSVFWITMALSAVMYTLLFMLAPTIASYYSMPILGPLLRVTGIILFPGAVVSIQTAFISRELKFRKLFVGSLIAVIISGVLAILSASQGAGPWAMSLQQIVYYFVLMFAMLFMISWKPTFVLRLDRVAALIGFGWKILVAGLLDTFWTGVYGLVIGKKFSAAELGGYNRGEQFPKIIATNLGAAIQSVMLPAYSKVQDNLTALRGMLKKTIKYSSFFLTPMMAGLIAIAEPMVRVILTDKWLFCVPYLRIFCLSYILWPIHSANLQAINAQGRSDLFLKLEILKKISGIVLLLISIKWGVMMILIFKTINECFCAVINTAPNRRLLGYGIVRQLLDMLPSAVCSAIMCAAVWAIGFTKLASGNMIILLAAQIVTGVAVYIASSLFINKKTIDALAPLIKKAATNKR